MQCQQSDQQFPHDVSGSVREIVVGDAGTPGTDFRQVPQDRQRRRRPRQARNRRATSIASASVSWNDTCLMFIEYPTNRATARITTFFSTMTHICVMRGAMRSIQVRIAARTAGEGRVTVARSRTSMNVGHWHPSSYRRSEHEVDALHRLNGDFPVEDNAGVDHVDARQQRVALLGRHVRAVRPRFNRDHWIIRQCVKFLTVDLVLPAWLPHPDCMCAAE